MKGFVLAAGFGQRLRPLTETTPKPLMPVGNLPLIGYSLRLLSHHGITDVIVNVHHLGKQLRECLKDGADFGVSITYSDESEEILGTGGGLKKAHELLQDDTFVVVNSDTIVDVALDDVISTHKESGAVATMVLREDPQQEEYGQIEIDPSGRIRRILGQGQQHDALRGLMFAGIHVLEPRFLEYIPPDVNTCINRYAYLKALNNDEVLSSFVMDGYWADAGTPERYFQANLDALERRLQLRHADALGGFEVAPKRDVADVVRLGKDVDLGANTHIAPPVLLCDGARIGEGASVGPYLVLGQRAQVGRDAKVSRAVVLPGAKIDAGAVIDGAIVGKKGQLALNGDTL